MPLEESWKPEDRAIHEAQTLESVKKAIHTLYVSHEAQIRSYEQETARFEGYENYAQKGVLGRFFSKREPAVVRPAPQRKDLEILGQCKFPEERLIRIRQRVAEAIQNLDSKAIAELKGQDDHPLILWMLTLDEVPPTSAELDIASMAGSWFASTQRGSGRYPPVPEEQARLLALKDVLGDRWKRMEKEFKDSLTPGRITQKP